MDNENKLLQYAKDVHIVAEYFRAAPKSVKRAANRIGDDRLHDALDMFMLNKEFDINGEVS